MAQNPITLSTTPPYPGLQLVMDVNDALDSLASDFAGPSDPAAVAKPYSLWLDTSNASYPVLRRRNAANNAWVAVAAGYGNEVLSYALSSSYSLPAGTPTALRPNIMQVNTFPSGAYATGTGVISLPAGGGFRISGNARFTIGAQPAMMIVALYAGASGSSESQRAVEVHTMQTGDHTYSFNFNVFQSAASSWRVMMVTTATGSQVNSGTICVERLTSRSA